ncbi:MAG: HNH endonuclease signature motif containing protein [bacterium]|nr:HNH endonuclease signature motif containing protein [bacterium]
MKEWKQNKRATDPDYDEREKAKARERSRKKRADPKQREKENAKQRAYQNRQYAENPVWREKAKAKVRNRRRALGGRKPHRYGPVLLMRDGSLCHICGSTVYLAGGWHVDHYIPLDAADQFGDDVVNSLENLRLTHPACNIAKNNRIPPSLKPRI